MFNLTLNESKKTCLVMLFNNNFNVIQKKIQHFYGQTINNWTLFIICDENIGFVDDFHKLEKINQNKNVVFEKIKTKNHYGYINHKIKTLTNEFSHFTILNSCDAFYPNYLKFMINEKKYFVYGNCHVSKCSSKNTLLNDTNNINNFIKNYQKICFSLWSAKIVKALGLLNLNTPEPLFDYYIRTLLVLKPRDVSYIQTPLGKCFCKNNTESYLNSITQTKNLVKDKDISTLLKYSAIMNNIPPSFHPLVIMPTYNRANNIEERINMMINQIYENWTFIIIDDGSTIENKKKYYKMKEDYSYDNRIIFLENENNSKVPYTLNKGIKYFLENEHLSHLTWVSDDNIYYNNYLSDLFVNNKDFVYSAYDILNKNNDSRGINNWQYRSYESLLNRFDGCASFMWSRNAINKIGCYNEKIPGCEDYEYLLRTFRDLSLSDIEYVDKTLMTFIKHPDQGTVKEEDRIFLLKKEINEQFKTLYMCMKLNYELENGESFSLNEIVKILLENKIYKIKYLKENNFNSIIKTLDKFFIKNDSYSSVEGVYNPINVTYINNIPKILFTYWDMSNLTFMHFMTLYTLKKHHPDYEIILYYPKKRITQKTWTSFENKIEVNCKCYKKYLVLLNIRIIGIDFENDLPDIPFYLSEVIKSDFFRLLVCKEVGGIWFDMDTFWINNIQNAIDNDNDNNNYYEDLVTLNKTYNTDNSLDNSSSMLSKGYDYSYFVMCSKKQDNVDKNFPHFCQYILLHNNKSKLVKLLYDSCLSHLNCDQYESIGTPMFSKILSKYILYDKDYNYNKNILNINCFAPYKWFQMEELFEKTIEINLDNTSCLHWFNGSPYSKKFIENYSHYNIDSMKECSFKNIYNKYITNEDKLFLKNMDSSINNTKISIVIAYFNRKDQLLMTLESIKKSNYLNKEIIIVDDNSREDQKVEAFINRFKGNLDIKVITITEKEKTWVNPCIPYNIGIKKAQGDIIVLQNPEVMHVGDCLTFINNNLNKKDWISFNCYGSPNFNFNNELLHKTSNECFEKINGIQFNIGGNSVERDDVGGWVNHYEKHFVGYHYLAAIHKSDINEYMNGGFNENFKNGVGCDDDELIKRLIHNKFNFKISEFKSEKPFCLHLYHEKPEQLKNLDWRENKKFFIESCVNMNMTPQNDIARAPYSETPMSRRIII